VKKPKPQLPGDVLVALRETEGFFSHREFADTLAMSPTTLWRLEKVRWDSSPECWSRRVEHSDIETLVLAGWIKPGDVWWERFRTALAWQHLVLKYGKAIYADEGAPLRLLEPISEEHVLAMVAAVVTREVLRQTSNSTAFDEDRQRVLVDKVSAEVLFRLATMELVLTKESELPITPESEQTRAISDMMVPGDAETPYVRTLMFVYEWACQETAKRMDSSETESG
jgi:hypothetical protein